MRPTCARNGPGRSASTRRRNAGGAKARGEISDGGGGAARGVVVDHYHLVRAVALRQQTLQARGEQRGAAIRAHDHRDVHRAASARRRRETVTTAATYSTQN